MLWRGTWQEPSGLWKAASLRAKSDPWSTSCKKMGTSVRYKMNSAKHLRKVGSGFPKLNFQMKIRSAEIVISAIRDTKQKIQILDSWEL